MNYKYKKYIEYIARDIQVPYIKSLEPYGLKQEEIDLVLEIVFNQSVHYIEPMSGVYNKYKVCIYSETSNGFWIKYDYDDDGNQIYREDADGCWVKREYDDQGKITYREDDDFWQKWTYDEQGYQVYYEDSDGYWEKKEYNEEGNEIYYENSYGFIEDNR